MAEAGAAAEGSGHDERSSRDASAERGGAGGETAGMDWQSLLGGRLLRDDGGMQDVAALTGAPVAIFFSAAWCAPCREFMPLLKAFYTAVASRGQVLHVIFATRECTAAEFNEYFAEMPWLAFPHGDSRCQLLWDHLAAVGIPTLAFFRPSGELYTMNGRSFVEDDALGERFPWWDKDAAAEEAAEAPVRSKSAEEDARKLVDDVTREVRLTVSSRLPDGVPDAHAVLSVPGPIVDADGALHSSDELRGQRVLVFFASLRNPATTDYYVPRLQRLWKARGGVGDWKLLLASRDCVCADSDDSAACWAKLMKGTPWLALRKGDVRSTLLVQLLQIRQLPFAVLIEPSGMVAVRNVLDALEGDPNGLRFPWHRPAPLLPPDSFFLQHRAASAHLAVLPKRVYWSFADIDFAGAVDKLRALSERVDAFKWSAGDALELRFILQQLKEAPELEGEYPTPFRPTSMAAISKLLAGPEEVHLAVLDLVRILLTHTHSAYWFRKHAGHDLLARVSSLLQEEQVTAVHVVALRLLSNLMLKPATREVVMVELQQTDRMLHLLALLAPHAHSDSAAVRLSLATLFANLATMLLDFGSSLLRVRLAIADALLDWQLQEAEPHVAARALIALGTLLAGVAQPRRLLQASAVRLAAQQLRGHHGGEEGRKVEEDEEAREGELARLTRERAKRLVILLRRRLLQLAAYPARESDAILSQLRAACNDVSLLCGWPPLAGK